MIVGVCHVVIVYIIMSHIMIVNILKNMVRDILITMSDTVTGEVLYVKRATKEFFCCTGGEQYIKRVIDSLFRGIRQGRTLSLSIDVKPVECEEPDLFEVVAYEP